MEIVQCVQIYGFSSTYNPFYSDEFTIERDGNVYYHGIIGDLHYNWEFHTKSDGFLLTFTGLVIELFNSNFNQVIKDDKKNGYKIEIITEEDDHYIYTFYGLMEENEQESIRNVLTEFIPIFEELPEYMESKEEEYEEETEYLES